MKEILEKYCNFIENGDYYFKFDKSFLEYHKKDRVNFAAYMFRFSIYNHDEIDMWRKDSKLHTFTSPEKLEKFFMLLE